MRLCKEVSSDSDPERLHSMFLVPFFLLLFVFLSVLGFPHLEEKVRGTELGLGSPDT